MAFDIKVDRERVSGSEGNKPAWEHQGPFRVKENYTQKRDNVY